MATNEELQLQIQNLSTQLAAQTADFQTQLNLLKVDVDTFWLIIFGALVFMMQGGFAVLEGGCVRSKNVVNIIYKNILDTCVTAFSWYLVGYAFAFGDHGRFIGYHYFACVDVGYAPSDNVDGQSYAHWFFQYTFCAVAATIASGAIAERTQLIAYLIYTFVVSAWIYPVVAHWAWSPNGWLSAFRPDPIISTNGYIDFAGSGVVHVVGGFGGLVGAIVIGPRLGRFDNDGPKPQGHNIVLVALGVFMLWFGWYGFNPGSTLGASNGFSGLAGAVAVNTTLGGAFGGLSSLIFGSILDRKMILGTTLNGVLAGLVSVTGPCSVIAPWAAVVIGSLAGIFYCLGSRLLIILKIDDPVDAFPVHGICGAWGVFATGIFANGGSVNKSYHSASPLADPDSGWIVGGGGKQFAVQLVGLVTIILWTSLSSLVIFIALNLLKLLRVPVEEERMGLDESKHGGHAYPEHSLIMRTLASKVMTREEN